ncbi:MAG: fatty acid desaturase [Pseudomonadota bacterium]
MVLPNWASRASGSRTRFEGPTWAALAGCYGLWCVGLWVYGVASVAGLPLLAVAAAFHSSLQHEILHGHPTRSAAINEALVFPALGLFIPYRRFRDMHLKHHNDDRLTDPYDDPESFYLQMGDWRERPGVLRSLLLFNGTFLGRMIVGPGLAMAGFWRDEALAVQRGDRGVRTAWVRHLAGVGIVVALLIWAGVPVWLYVLAVAYPAMSLIMVRSYIEHRAAETADERTVVIEGHWFWRLLFLNNNYHAVHHDRPALAWYRIPAAWEEDREAFLARNGGYHYRGYGEVARRWLFRRREPVVHPFIGHDGYSGPEQTP